MRLVPRGDPREKADAVSGGFLQGDVSEMRARSRVAARAMWTCLLEQTRHKEWSSMSEGKDVSPRCFRSAGLKSIDVWVATDDGSNPAGGGGDLARCVKWGSPRGTTRILFERPHGRFAHSE